MKDVNYDVLGFLIFKGRRCYLFNETWRDSLKPLIISTLKKCTKNLKETIEMREVPRDWVYLKTISTN